MLGQLAKRFAPGYVDWMHADPQTTSGLRKYFSDDWLGKLVGKRVVDWGCGRGSDVVAAALAGAAEVVGIDIQEDRLIAGRAMAEHQGVGDRCRFINARTEPEAYGALVGTFDFGLTVDAFEHFDDPSMVLAGMHDLLKPAGTLLISFGPPWKHPFGAHLAEWITLPWIHFAFDEDTVLAVRSHYLKDGATRFADVPGGLNKMTLARAEELLARSGFEVTMFEPRPIRPLRALAKLSACREYITSIVRAVCVRSEAAA